jgi:sortase (surface protein transpeptidase)
MGKKIYWVTGFLLVAILGVIKSAPVISAVPIAADNEPAPVETLRIEPITEEIPVVEAATIVNQAVYSTTPGRPIWINIPDIKVNTNVIDVGVTATNNLDVPPNYTEVGWYKYGTKPGGVGSAVLDGHVDNGASIAGPFKRLKELTVGDEVIVTVEDGSKLKFKVTDSSVYDTDKFPGEFVFHDKSGKLLKIITCHGRFVPSLDTYDQRLIVTAVLVE